REIKVSLPELGQGLLKIEKTGPVCVDQDAHGSGDAETTAIRLGAPGQVINQQAVRTDGKRERNGNAFAGIEKGERGIGGRIGANLTPGGRLRDPDTNQGGCVVLL